MAARTKVLAALIASILVAGPANLAGAPPSQRWAQTTGYPVPVAAESCVAASATVYCIGGSDGNDNSYGSVYYAPLSASGIGGWSAGPTYPARVDSASCVEASSAIYCVGGEDASTVVGDVYFAPLSSSGLGQWSNATAYPSPDSAPSCVAYSGYVYCVGGFDSGGDEVSSSFFAPVSSGLGPWQQTTRYPLRVDSESCVAYSGDIFCFGGETEDPSSKNVPVNETYYAPLTASGIGAWSPGPPYPVALAALSCAQDSGVAYCVGGFEGDQRSSPSADYAAISASGVGPWRVGTVYPSPVDTSSCVTALGYLYCVGGISDTGASSILESSYYVQTSAMSVPAGQGSARPGLSTEAWVLVVVALCLVVAAGSIRRSRSEARKA